MRSSSRPALAFDRSAHTSADLKKFWKADPLGAAKWLQNVGRATPNPIQGLAEVEAILAARGGDAFKAKRLTALVEKNASVLEMAPLPVGSLGWVSSDAYVEPAAFTGKLTLAADGIVELKTTRGNFALAFQANSDWRDEVETAFLNQVVTIKGTPSSDGQTLTIEQFAPGASADFISGRIGVVGDQVYIWPKGLDFGPMVQVTDPELVMLLSKNDAAGLVSYDEAGVILPGKVVVDDQGRAQYPGKAPDGFYLLGRLQGVPAQPLPNGKQFLVGETGYYHGTDMVAPAGLRVPRGVGPNAAGRAGDLTTGDTVAGSGHRTFFYVKPLPADAKVEGLALVSDRRVELTWLGKQSDQGSHVPTPMDSPTVEQAARSVPAAQPRMSDEAATFVPEDAARFSR